MSTHIIDHVIGIRLPIAEHDPEEPVFVIVHQGGDNNVISRETNRRAKEWYVASCGAEWQVLQEACDLARDCCGGCVKLHGRLTEPDTMIRKYRRAMKEAITVEHARRAGIHLVGKIKIARPKGNEDNWKPEQAAKYQIPLTDHVSYGTVFYESQEFDLANPELLALWFTASKN